MTPSGKILHIAESDLEKAISDGVSYILRNLLELSIESPEEDASSVDGYCDVRQTILPGTASDDVDTFLAKYYKKDSDGVVSIKDVKGKQGYKDEYGEILNIKQIPVCKKCGKKWRKGCCAGYGQNSRTARVMVLGWTSDV
jgi:hypothetical protein